MVRARDETGRRKGLPDPPTGPRGPHYRTWPPPGKADRSGPAFRAATNAAVSRGKTIEGRFERYSPLRPRESHTRPNSTGDRRRGPVVARATIFRVARFLSRWPRWDATSGESRRGWSAGEGTSERVAVRPDDHRERRGYRHRRR